jgi:hypothetical protein
VRAVYLRRLTTREKRVDYRLPVHCLKSKNPKTKVIKKELDIVL